MDKKKKTAPKPRNPVAEAAWFRSGAGTHQKSYKTERASVKVKLRKENYNE